METVFKAKHISKYQVNIVQGYIRQQLFALRIPQEIIGLIIFFYAIDPMSEIAELRAVTVCALQAFDSMDLDDWGDLDCNQLRDGLKLLNVSLTENDVDQVFKFMDYDSALYVDRNEFAMFLSQRFESSYLTRVQHAILCKIGAISEKATTFEDEVIGDPMREIADLHANSEVLWRTYDEIDLDDGGAVELPEFKDGMKQLNVSLTSKEIKQVFEFMVSDSDFAHYGFNFVGRHEFTMFLLQRFESIELTRLQNAILSKVGDAKTKQLSQERMLAFEGKKIAMLKEEKQEQQQDCLEEMMEEMFQESMAAMLNDGRNEGRNDGSHL